MMTPIMYRFMTLEELLDSLPFTEGERELLIALHKNSEEIGRELEWWHQRDKWLMSQDDLALYYAAINAKKAHRDEIRLLVGRVYQRSKSGNVDGQK